MTTIYDTIIIGTAETMHRLERQHNAEVEKYRERLGTVTALLGCVKTAIKQGRAIEAAEFVNLAEQVASGCNPTPVRIGPQWDQPEERAV